MNKFFNRLNIENVNFHRVDKSPLGGRYGCFESHYTVADKATSDIVIVFEDDCVIKDGAKVDWNDIVNKIRLYFASGYDFFSVGCVPISSIPIQLGDGLVESKFQSLLCYAIKKKKFNELKDDMLFILKNKIISHIDFYYTSNIDMKVGFSIPKFTQNTFDTNNAWIDVKFLNSLPIANGFELMTRHIENTINSYDGTEKSLLIKARYQLYCLFNLFFLVVHQFITVAHRTYFRCNCDPDSDQDVQSSTHND